MNNSHPADIKMAGWLFRFLSEPELTYAVCRYKLISSTSASASIL